MDNIIKFVASYDNKISEYSLTKDIIDKYVVLTDDMDNFDIEINKEYIIHPDYRTIQVPYSLIYNKIHVHYDTALDIIENCSTVELFAMPNETIIQYIDILIKNVYLLYVSFNGFKHVKIIKKWIVDCPNIIQVNMGSLPYNKICNYNL
jgi:hypothetical protein